MAIAGTHTDLVQLISEEDEKIELKRTATDNASWNTINLDNDSHGAGLIDEETWKEKYSPNSQERTEI